MPETEREPNTSQSDHGIETEPQKRPNLLFPNIETWAFLLWLTMGVQCRENYLIVLRVRTYLDLTRKAKRPLPLKISVPRSKLQSPGKAPLCRPLRRWDQTHRHTHSGRSYQTRSQLL